MYHADNVTIINNILDMYIKYIDSESISAKMKMTQCNLLRYIYLAYTSLCNRK